MFHVLQSTSFILLYFSLSFSFVSSKTFDDINWSSNWIDLKSGAKLRERPSPTAKIIAVIPFEEKVQAVYVGVQNKPDGYGKIISWVKVHWQNKTGWLPHYCLAGSPYMPPLHPSKYKAVREFKTDTRRAVKMAKEDLRIVIDNWIEWATGNPEQIETCTS